MPPLRQEVDCVAMPASRLFVTFAIGAGIADVPLPRALLAVIRKRGFLSVCREGFGSLA